MIFVTSSKDKFEEARLIIPQLVQKELELPEIQELDPRKIIEFKLKAACELSSKETAIVVEDVSLNLAALGKLPGPFIKWFLKELGPEGVYKLAGALPSQRASVSCWIGLLKDQCVSYFHATVDGEIVAPRGSNGFGFDSIFSPVGQEMTFAEMSRADKSTFSMRRKAFELLKVALSQETERKPPNESIK